MSATEEARPQVFIRCPACLGEVHQDENDLPPSSPFRCRSCRQRQSDTARRYAAQESAYTSRSDDNAKSDDNDSVESPSFGKSAKRDRKTQPPTEQ